MTPELKNILLFTMPCWITNMALNGLYIAKTAYPKLTKFDKPLDGKAYWMDNKRILGDSTTWPGLFLAIGCGFILSKLVSIDLTFAIVTTIAVYIGHATGSFIKRRLGYDDGQYMPFVDHGDYVIMVGIITFCMHRFSLLTILIGISITYLVHPIVTYLAYKLKLHKYPR